MGNNNNNNNNNNYLEKRLSDFPSTEEFWGYIYFKELEAKGYINEIIEQVAYDLYPAVYHNELIQLKTKLKSVSKVISKPRIYTLDFEIHWSDKAKHTPLITDFDNSHKGKKFLIKINQGLKSHIEVKGDYDSNNATRYFLSRTQPEMLKKDGNDIYVQLCKIPSLFKETFIPELLWDSFHYKKDVYYKTKKGVPHKLKARKGDPKYKWNYRRLEDYING